MRLHPFLTLPATLILSMGLLAAGCDESEGQDMAPAKRNFSSTPTYTGAHPDVKANPMAVTPPPATPSYPQASSGPGTPPIVPQAIQPAVIDFVRQELDRAKQLAANGKTTEAASVIDGIKLHRSSWSRQTQAQLDPQIAAAQKSVTPAQPAK